MSVVSVRIDDSLQDRVDTSIEEVKAAILEWLEEHEDATSLDLGNDINHDGRVDEIVDGNVPVYYSDIKGIYYLHGDMLDEAYDAAGLYDDRPDNYTQVCIYIYLEQQVHEWFNNMEIDLEEWRASGEDFGDFMDWDD